MRNYLLLILFVPLAVYAQDFSVGSWREHLPYSNVNYVVPMEDKVYASTPYSLYYYDLEDNSVNRLSTINGLSELGVALIHPNPQNKTVVVGYSSGNIDLIKSGNIVNIPAIINSNVIGDKTIYGMYSKGDYTYLATGFGIVVVDVDREEIKDTYYIGANGDQIKVNDLTIGSGNIYAATDMGVLYASESTPFLSNPASWTELVVSGATQPDFQLIEHSSSATTNRLIVVQKGADYADDLGFVLENGNWSSPSELAGDDIYSIENDGTNLIVAKNVGVVVYDQNFSALENLYSIGGTATLSPNHAVKLGDEFWVGDRKQGLLKMVSNWSFDKYPITGPYSNEAVQLSCNGDDLWVASGRIDGTNWNNTYNWRGAFHFDQQNWEAVNRTTVPTLADSVTLVFDFIWTTIDPSNNDHVFLSSFNGGLIEVLAGNFLERHSYYNSSLRTRINQNGNNVCVSATCFDNSGNLWVANSFVAQPLSVLSSDGDWMSFSCGPLGSNALCTDLYVDKTMGYIWMAIKNVGLLVYDNNQTPLDANDDQYRVLSSATGQGGLPNTVVNTITEDLDGEIWIGTEHGPAVIYNIFDMFSGNENDAQQILLNLDGTVQLLLENENISEILVDGGNRKWIATNGGGLFLMSEDGTEMIHSFNKENSPLFSDNVLSIAMNDNTGELYIATEEGIMGFKAEAVAAQQQFNDVYAYPNPVRPEYNGTIAIKGFMQQSEVKITDASGNLVFSTVSIGGQAVWNGKTLDGNRVQSGVYYVFATSSDGSQKTKTKILFIN